MTELLDPIKGLIPEEWGLVHLYFEWALALVIFLALLIATWRQLRDTVATCVKGLGWCWNITRQTCRKINPDWQRAPLSLENVRIVFLHLKLELYVRWRCWCLKKGWIKMNVDLSGLTPRLREKHSGSTKKRLVSIALSGEPRSIDQSGNVTSRGPMMVEHVIKQGDKNLLANLQERKPDRFTVFLSELASAVVDDWDTKVKKLDQSGTIDAKLDDVEEELDDWIAKYEIPYQVLGEYIQDALGYKKDT